MKTTVARASAASVVVCLTAFVQAVAAGSRGTPQERRASQAISQFLASVELAEAATTFDHDHDGVVDMTVYPLKTTAPDLDTKYTTLQEELAGGKVLLKEDPALVTPSRNNPPGSYPVVAQIIGGGYSSYGSYYPRGGLIGGGWQSRGFRSGGILGGYPYGGGYRPGGYGPGYRPGDYRPGGGYYRPGYRNAPWRPGTFKNLAVGAQIPPSSSTVAPKADLPVDALCFEKWRLIEQSRLQGRPEYFRYVGLASPYIRKQLVSFANQANIHIAIETELRILGVDSPTKALIDIFADPRIRQVIDYYLANGKHLLDGNKDISGMVVTDGYRILAADVYSSPRLFEKMVPQLIQSAAVGVCRSEPIRRKTTKQDVKKFLDTLKHVSRVKAETPQSYRFFATTLIGAAELLGDETSGIPVHIEAYPR